MGGKFKTQAPPPLTGGPFLPLAGGTMSGTIAVSADNTIDLGAIDKRWRAIYGHTATLTDSLTGTGGTFSIIAPAATSPASGTHFRVIAGTGAPGTVGNPGSNGGALTMKSGGGGAGSATQVGGNAANVYIDTGIKGADAGAGEGNPGIICIGNDGIGAGNCQAVVIGNPTALTVVAGELRYDNSSNTANEGGIVPPASGKYAGYLVVNVSGTDMKIPYFNV